MHVVDLFTEHTGRAFYLPTGKAPKYTTLDKAKDACLVLRKCTGVVEAAKDFMLHTGMEIYSTGDKKVKTWIKSDCTAGRFGKMCEHKCQTCDDDVPCNPHTGLCGDSLFCNKTDRTFTCEKGSLIGGRCPTEDGWIYWYGSCYYINGTEIQDWMQADDMCRKYSGTDLLWITSEVEKKALLSLLPRGDYWTGLHGNWFCSHLHWSHRHAIFTPSEWLWTGQWTFYWACCVHLTVPEGEMTGTRCGRKASFICKKREEGNTNEHLDTK
nr:macrophage mannose receptor 1-like [Anolis sagrei ordinatus]